MTTTHGHPVGTDPWDDVAAPPPPDGPAHPIGVAAEPPGRQRRWTVALRLILVVPVAMWTGVIGMATSVVAVYCWFAVLITGRRPSEPTPLLRGSLHLLVRYMSYVLLLTDVFPPLDLSARDYPVRLSLPDHGPGSRLTVFFRAFLVIPAVLVSNLLLGGFVVTGLFLWLFVLVTGRTPRAYYQAGLAIVRWQVRTQAYGILMTGQWPWQLFGDPAGEAPIGFDGEDPRDAERRNGVLRLGRGPTIWLATLLALGLVYLGWIVRQDLAAYSALTHPADTTAQAQGTLPPATAELLARVPADLRASCTTSPDPAADGLDAPQEITALSCPLARPGQAPAALVYRLYPDSAAAQAPYDRLMQATAGRLPDGNTQCAQGRPGSGNWLNQDNSVGGSMACSFTPAGPGSSGSAYLFWTAPAAHVTAEIDLGQPDLPQVYGLWMSQPLLNY